MGERRVRTRYGFRYHADLGDWLGQYVYLTGGYEPATADLIARLLEPGDVFVDVGANSGFFTLLAASRVGPAGKVLSFEPLTAMRKRLVDNLALNGLGNVAVHTVALSNRRGENSFYEGPTGHKGLSSLRPIPNSAAMLKVPTMRLDDLDIAGVRIKLIKIDVEGAEQLVVEGATSILARDKPRLIVEITEEYLKSYNHSASGLRRILAGMGYSMYRIAPEGLTTIPEGEEGKEAQYNAFFSATTLPNAVAPVS